MKPYDLEGELMQYGLQHREQKLLADLAGAAHDLPLSHRVDGIDVVHALGPIPVPLMHRIDAQEPRPSLRVRLAPLAYRYRARSRRFEHGSPFAIPCALAQVVQVRYRDPGHPPELLLAELQVLALQNPPHRRSVQPFVRAIHFRQKCDVCIGVVAGELVPVIEPLLHAPAVQVRPDQPRDLCRAQSRHFSDVRTNQPALLPAESREFLRYHNAFCPRIYLCAPSPGELDFGARFQKLLDLLLVQMFGILHRQLHPAEACRHTQFHAHAALESTPVSCSSCIGQFSFMSRATHVLQWTVQSAANPRGGANRKKPFSVRIAGCNSPADRKSTRLNSSHLGISYAA